MNQSTESADGGDCLKFYKSLELIGIYAETKKKKKKKRKSTHKQYSNSFVKCNLRVERQTYVTDLF